MVFIVNIKDGSAASTFPTLSPGDILVGVAGKPVKNATMDDALKMIKSSPRPVDLEFMKPAVAGSIDTTIVNSDSNGTDVNSNSNSNQPFETNTYTVQAGSIGITLEEAMENPNLDVDTNLQSCNNCFVCQKNCHGRPFC